MLFSDAALYLIRNFGVDAMQQCSLPRQLNNLECNTEEITFYKSRTKNQLREILMD